MIKNCSVNCNTLYNQNSKVSETTTTPLNFGQKSELDNIADKDADKNNYLTMGLVGLGVLAAGALILKQRNAIKSLKCPGAPTVPTAPVGQLSNANESPLSKATELLINRWEAKAQLNSSLRGYIDNLKSGNVKPSDIYSTMLKDAYNEIRQADYPVTSHFNSKISDVTAKETADMVVKSENNWHYRIPKNRKQMGWTTNCNCTDRISVNAQTDEKLIAELDKLFGAGEVKGYYKTPDISDAWLLRHDPITIYLHENATPDVLSKIETLTKPYIRSSEDVLVGNKFAPGLALEKSPQVQDIQDLISAAEKVDPELGKAFRNEMSQNNNLKASAGQITAAKKVLSLLQ